MKCKKVVMRVIAAIVITVLFVGAIWDFSTQMQRTLTKEAYAILSAVSKDYNKAFLDRISYNMKTMNVIAGGLEEMQGKSKEVVLRVLRKAVSDGGFSQMVICDTNGNSYSNENTFMNIANRDYFKKAMRGESSVSKPARADAESEEYIVIAVPIHDAAAVTGVLLGVYPISTASKQLFDFTAHSNSYGFVVEPNGAIVLASEHEDKLSDNKNLFAFFASMDFVDFSFAQLKQSIANGESGNFAFTYKNNRRFVSYAPSTINDWYTFSVSSDAELLQQEQYTNRIMAQLVVTLGLMGILLVIWLAIESKWRNQEIIQANRKYQSLLSHINGGMVVSNHAETAEGTIVTYVSDGFTQMTGYTLEDIKVLHQGGYLNIVYEPDRAETLARYLAQVKKDKTYHLPYRIQKKNGDILWAVDNGYLIEDENGLHNHSIITDITQMRQQEEKLRLSEKRFSLAVNASSGTLFEVDLKRQLYTHFENAERIFGVKAEKLLADTSAFAALSPEQFEKAVTDYFFHPDDAALTKKKMQEMLRNKTASYEARLRRGDGSYIWARIDLNLVRDANGVPSLLIGYMSDIDAIKKEAERLENKVQTDAMTGLYNKVAMGTLANKTLQEYPNGHHALFVLDIDNFKGINDTLGHAFGDLVLIEVCAKLKSSFRNCDIVGRMGGDEFAVLMQNVPDKSSVLKKATELAAAFRQTYVGEAENYKITCSIGIILIEKNHESFEMLYRKADAALYQAKRNGKDQFVFYQESEAQSYPIVYTRTDDEELQNLKASHNMEAQIFELLYTAKDFALSVQMALAAIGQHYHVSRVAIFENNEDNSATSNSYEWCNVGVSGALPRLQKVKLVENGVSLLDFFDANGLLYCSDICELPTYFSNILASKEVLATLQVTIVNDEKVCGFIGFDECEEHRVWQAEEIEKLSFLAKVLSVFLFKRKAEVSVLENLQNRLKILDVLPDYICVVNPENHMLIYANHKMQTLIPSAKAGAFCFQTLHGGQTAPCATCMMERIKRGETDNLEIVSANAKMRLKINALSIHWANDKQMVLLYGTEQDR